MKLQNSAIVASRKLDAYLYYLLGDNLPCDGHYENLKEAEKWGFKISDLTRKCKTLQEVFDFIKYWDVERKNLPVATDGIVLKVNSCDSSVIWVLRQNHPDGPLHTSFKPNRHLPA